MSRSLAGCLVVAALTAGIGLLTGALRTHASTGSLSREALFSSFEADLRNVVYAWDPNDRSSETERRQRLFDFVYQTYQASAWIPQSLFDSNLVTQAVVGDVNTIVRDKVGLVLWRDNARVAAFGMAPDLDSNGPLRWTVNCLVCHTAEIDGVAYLGAGTKTFDDVWLGDALKRLTSDRRRRLLPIASADDRLAADANRILNAHHHDKIDALTRGRSTAFAASHVELYMQTHGGAMPAVDRVGRGDVKTPPLWHTAAKMTSARWYSDGSFHGSLPLMASSMELEKDRSFDALVQVVMPTIKGEFASVTRHLRPPRYPYEIDRALAERGRQLFYSPEVGCSVCHGVYDGRGNVEWPGVHADVGTDPARLEVVSEKFVQAFQASPIAAEGDLVKSEGYAATPLTGVWANFPYLHNGSVPTLHHLLGPVSERPQIFEVMAARRFDQRRVGQRLHVDPVAEGIDDAEAVRRFGSDRNWFSVARTGCSNAGHDVWPRIRTEANRLALIEYLKTL